MTSTIICKSITYKSITPTPKIYLEVGFPGSSCKFVYTIQNKSSVSLIKII